MSSGYGEFDPKFAGISIHADSPGAWDRIQRHFFEADAPDLDAVSTPQQFMDVVAGVSVPIHELRHFHDFLISDYGGRIVRARLQVVLNMLEIVRAFQQLGTWREANVVLTPLSDWCRLDADQRREEIDGLNWTGAGYRPPNLPYFTDRWALPNRSQAGLNPFSQKTLASQLEICGYYQERVRWLNSKPKGTEEAPHYPQQFAEASAILCQAAEIMNVWDAGTANRFLDMLLTPGNRYGMALRDVSALFKGVDAILVSAFLSWCLFGNYESGIDAFPIMRFARLGYQITVQPGRVLPATVPTAPDEWHQLFERWDDLTSQPSMMEGLRSSVQEMENSFTKVRSRLEETSLPYADFLMGIGQIVQARSHMVEQFVADPGAYINPFAYRLHMDHWTAAPLKIAVPESAALTDVNEDQWILHAYRKDLAGRKLSNILVRRKPLRGVQQIDPEAALLVYSLTSTADVLIGPCPPDVSTLDRQLAETLIGARTLPLIR